MEDGGGWASFPALVNFSVIYKKIENAVGYYYPLSFPNYT